MNAPQSARSGLPAACARQYKRRRDGQLEEQGPFGPIVVAPGETVVSISSGAGGYGPPWERDPRRVVRDVAEGFVSRARAVEVYGVAVDENGALDEARTEELRQRYVAGVIGSPR